MASALGCGKPAPSAGSERRRARAHARRSADRLIIKLRARLLRAGLAPLAQPDAVDREVAARQAIARPALRALVAGAARNGPTVLRRNVAEHAASCPSAEAPLGAFRAAQRSGRLESRCSLPVDVADALASSLAALPAGASYWIGSELDAALMAAAADSQRVNGLLLTRCSGRFDSEPLVQPLDLEEHCAQPSTRHAALRWAAVPFAPSAAHRAARLAARKRGRWGGAQARVGYGATRAAEAGGQPLLHPPGGQSTRGLFRGKCTRGGAIGGKALSGGQRLPCRPLTDPPDFHFGAMKNIPRASATGTRS